MRVFFFGEPHHASNTSSSLSSESSTTTNIAKKNVQISTESIGDAQQSFSSSSYETIKKQTSSKLVQKYNETRTSNYYPARLPLYF